MDFEERQVCSLFHAVAIAVHIGEGAKARYLRQAVAQGFDHAAFMDRRGRLSEATIWNLAFWDGVAVAGRVRRCQPEQCGGMWPGTSLHIAGMYTGREDDVFYLVLRQ